MKEQALQLKCLEDHPGEEWEEEEEEEEAEDEEWEGEVEGDFVDDADAFGEE